MPPMLWYILNNRYTMDIYSLLYLMLGYAVVIFLTLPVHECAHAFAAHLCGDDTAKWHGRMTLNPFAHLDLFGTLMMLAVGIGYAKPVPVVSRNLHHYRRDMVFISLAGPLSNLLMAIVAAGLFRLCMVFISSRYVLYILWLILINTVASINITLAVFNLLPIPPLDGSRLWSTLLPGRWSAWLEQNSRYVQIGLFVVLMLGLLDGPLSWLQLVFGTGVGALFGEPHMFSFSALFS